MKQTKPKLDAAPIFHVEHRAEEGTGVLVEHEEHGRRDLVRVSIWDQALEDAFARLAPAQARELAKSLIEVANRVDALRTNNVIPMAARGTR